MPNFEIIFWFAAIIAFGAAEALTSSLVSIWFVVGAAFAMFSALLDLPVVAQAFVFLVVSAIALIVTKPLVKKLHKGTPTPTNADRVIGQSAKVTEKIDNINAAGAVYVDGKSWSARSKNGETIPVGTMVTIEQINGVKLIVTAKTQ